MKILFLTIIIFLIGAGHKSAYSIPKDPENYNIVSGLVEIVDGSYVEGSAKAGGMQPDYFIDYNHPEIARLRNYAKKTASTEPDFWKRITKIITYIQKHHLLERAYDSKEYLNLSKKYKNKNIPLGEYSVCKVGVCRENALYLHIALKEAGIENFHGYAQIKRSSRTDKFEIVEDHGFVVIEKK